MSIVKLEKKHKEDNRCLLYICTAYGLRLVTAKGLGFFYLKRAYLEIHPNISLLNKSMNSYMRWKETRFTDCQRLSR